ncbi:MAG: methionine adenosyltransferase [Vallitalea sp.]|jgi:S-adenosylmethionine synthetase|nr:methionine adenosyltransferase [Vallitalea sp.]
MKRLFTSESVTEGHPDKICDQISDAILDAILIKDSNARVACEVAVTTNFVLVTGEITTNCHINIEKIVRKTIKQIGYNRKDEGFNYKTCEVIIILNEQSKDISVGVNKALNSKDNAIKTSSIGAGDQGMMFGYACNETEELVPMPIYLAHKLTQMLTTVRKNNILEYLRPDGKSQVTVEYFDGKPIRVDTIVLSAQHNENVSKDKIEKDLRKYVIDTVIPPELLDEKTKYLINPTGRFVIGGPQGDSGLTGRKIIVDTYGGYGSHGGGAFSGKDPTKVDRSGAYSARYVAKNVVASQIASKCQVEIAYAIGVAEPVSILVDTYNTGKISDDEITKIIKKHFDLRPGAIIKELELHRPIYKQTSAYGHFGRRDIDLPWEKTDKADILKKEVFA